MMLFCALSFFEHANGSMWFHKERKRTHVAFLGRFFLTDSSEYSKIHGSLMPGAIHGSYDVFGSLGSFLPRIMTL